MEKTGMWIIGSAVLVCLAIFVLGFAVPVVNTLYFDDYVPTDYSVEYVVNDDAVNALAHNAMLREQTFGADDFVAIQVLSNGK